MESLHLTASLDTLRLPTPFGLFLDMVEGSVESPHSRMLEVLPGQTLSAKTHNLVRSEPAAQTSPLKSRIRSQTIRDLGDLGPLRGLARRLISIVNHVWLSQ